MTTDDSKSTERIRQQELKNKLNKMAWVSDGMIPLPGKFKLGLDSLIGLVPVIGDGISALFSFYVIRVGLKAKVPKAVFIQMIFNVFIDAIFGVVPIIGDLFDMAFRANERNVKLLNKYVDQPEDTTRTANRWLLFVLFLLAGLMLVSLWLVWFLLQQLIALF